MFYLDYMPSHISILKDMEARTQDRNLKQTLPRDADHYSTVLLVLNYFAYTVQAHLPRNGTAHSEQGPLTSVVNQDSLSQTWPWANLIDANSSGDVPSSQMIGDLIKMTIQTN